MSGPVNPIIGLMKDQVLCQQELDLKIREHMIASMRDDKARMAKARDEALTAFYAMISANESLAFKIAKLGG